MTTTPIPPRSTDGATPDRLPPQDSDAEMSLLGSMLLDREAIELVLPIIGREEARALYNPAHRKLFETLIDLYDQGKPIDLIVVKNELLRRRQLDDVGGEAKMIEMVQTVPTWVNAEHYARIVKDKSMLRDLIGCAGQILNDAYADGDEARMVMDRAERLMFEVTEQRISSQLQSLHETLNDVFRMIESRGDHYISGVTTGFVEFDELTSGLQPGEIIIIAARPSMGKTALSLNMAERLAAEGKVPTAYFSMEMTRQQVAQRILCSRGRIDAHRLRRGMLSEKEIAQLSYVCEELKDAPLFIDDTPGMTVLELRAKARRMHLKHDIRCLFVDYLQLMTAPGASRQNNRQEEIATISRGLKALSRELSIPVVAMAQLNRAAEIREDHRPRMSDLRESGAIEQDADVVALLHREEYFKPDDASLKGPGRVDYRQAAKRAHRHGQTPIQQAVDPLRQPVAGTGLRGQHAILGYHCPPEL